MEEDKRTVSRLFLFVLTLEIDSILVSRKIYNYRNYTKISLPCISKINSKKYKSTYYFFRKINKKF